jgi:hypothetical protein
MKDTLSQLLIDLTEDPSEVVIELEREEAANLDAGDEVPAFSLVLHVAEGTALVATGRIDGDGNAASVSVRCFASPNGPSSNRSRWRANSSSTTSGTGIVRTLEGVLHGPRAGADPTLVTSCRSMRIVRLRNSMRSTINPRASPGRIPVPASSGRTLVTHDGHFIADGDAGEAARAAGLVETEVAAALEQRDELWDEVVAAQSVLSAAIRSATARLIA